MKSILTVIGTRPEAIKLAPLLSAINESHSFKSKVCITRQHTDLLDPFLASLKNVINYAFDRAEKGNSLHQSAEQMLKQFAKIFKESKPDLVIVQGDTTTAFIAALSAFYASIPVAHVEAGLRTGNIDSPWPEEAHRSMITTLATYFFAPTQEAKENLLNEGISPQKIWVVGNTSIDALRLARSPIKSSANLRKVVVTAHRRENHGEPFKEICRAVRNLAQLYPEIRITFLIHPNPAVRGPAMELLSGIENVDLIEPMDHQSFIQLLDESFFIITDSGGIQEEAPFLGKPVVVIREETERPEGVKAGTAKIVGTQSSAIINCCKELIENEEMYKRMSKIHFPYGDGYASERIVRVLENELG